MNPAKRIFVIADFKEESPKSIRISPRMWIKGLIRAGCDVQRFSYRLMRCRMDPVSAIRLRRYLPGLVRRRTDRLLLRQIQAYDPAVILILSMKYLTADTVAKIRRAAPAALLVGRDEDPFPEQNPARLEIARQTDMVINTSAGRFLQTYKDAGVPRCAFLPNLCDPDIQYRHPVGPEWKTDLLFTGKPTHTRLSEIGDRYDLIKRIAQMPNGRVYGAFGTPGVEGLHYFYALSGAKIVLSINIVNDVPLYHSDRLINGLSCGSFMLAKRVPQTDLLYEDGKHLRYFDTEQEFFELADWYLKHETERDTIARAGREHVHQQYNAARMAQIFLELIRTGQCKEPWNTVL